MSRSRNSRLARVIEESGLTYDAIARAVVHVAASAGDNTLRTSRSTVSYWVSGTPPSPATARYLCEALSRRLGRVLTPYDLGLSGTPSSGPVDIGLTVDSDPVETLGELGRADIERRSFLTASAYSVAGAALPLGTAGEMKARTARALGGGIAGPAEIATVRDMVAMLTAIDGRHGGQYGRNTVVQYLMDDVIRLCRARWQSEALHSQMYSAAGSLAYLAGWKAFDAGEHGLAQRYYLQAFGLAQRSAPLDQAYVLRILAHHGMDNGRPEHVLGLADAALRLSRGTDPATQALFVSCRARALAVSRQGAEALREADRARELAATGEVAEITGWSRNWGSPHSTVDYHRAAINARIGNHSAAEAHYSAARRRWSTASHQRVAALSAASEGHAQLSQGRIEQACATWTGALDAMVGIRSSRTIKAVQAIRSDLAQFRARSARPAAELDDRARAWLRLEGATM
ncbi:hypothetical protein [Streptomyces qinzhouensis]|uniref:Tat pathway signal protein n=1 Tax=Streptomyces qinzhouensis TaxID=2599401 RepID=A0A5B8J6W9_9ACTN|nr:hypothetical protein [Streptomyces qinzhouensis]QDY77545.1 hypothetical protein FQU76_14555 [Streptomyces qinzhouensis]